MKIRFSIVVFLLFILLILNGCGNKTKDFVVTEFESNISVRDDKTEIQGILHFENSENVLFTVTSPEVLKNIKVNFNGKEIIVSASDVSVSMENISFGEDLFSPLFECICLLAASDNVISGEGTDKIILSGEKGEYRVEVNCDEEKIMSIENKDKIYKFG